jgi:AraC-like DNA-binding protein
LESELSYDLQRIFVLVDQALRKAPLTPLQEIARLLAIERHTIEKAVRTSTGKPFRAFRNEIAFQIARDQLQSHPSRSIKEISYELGYGSPRAFSRFVKCFCGHAPNELRGGNRVD